MIFINFEKLKYQSNVYLEISFRVYVQEVEQNIFQILDSLTSTVEFGSSQRCNTLDVFNISIEPLCMCFAFFFRAVIGESLTPCRKCCFDAVNILK